MFFLFVLWSCPAFAQDVLWSRTYGVSGFGVATPVQQTADGGYIVGGHISGHCLIKTDSLGDTMWVRAYGVGSGPSFSVLQTTDGGYILAGGTASGGDDFYLVKTDSLGDTLWSHTYGGSDQDKAYSVHQTMDGGYVMAGFTFSFGAGRSDFYLIKTDSLGDTLWSRTYGGSDYDYGNSVKQTSDGGYIVVGWTYSFGSAAAYLIKTDSLGDILWSRTYGGQGWLAPGTGYSVQQTADGGYILVGLWHSASTWGFCLIRTNSSGEILWARWYYCYSGLYFCGSVYQTTDGGYIMAGHAVPYGSSNYYDIYVVKADSLGDVQWSRIYGGSGGDDEGSCVQQTRDGGYIVSGNTRAFGPRSVMLTKLDSLGNTCIGEFVSSTVMSVSPTVTSPATVVTSPSTIVTSPTETVTSPPTEVTTVCIWQRGDANGDGVINIADVVYLLNYLFLSGSAPDPLWLGDANCDGVVNIADVVYLLNYLFGGGPPPGC